MEALESVLLYRAPTLRAVEKHGENIALVYSEVKSFESILRTFTGLVALHARSVRSCSNRLLKFWCPLLDIFRIVSKNSVRDGFKYSSI